MHLASWQGFPAAPLSSGVGRVEERTRARRAGRFPGKLLAAVVPPGLTWLPFGLSLNCAVSQFLAFWFTGGLGIVVPSGRHKSFRRTHATRCFGIFRFCGVAKLMKADVRHLDL